MPSVIVGLDVDGFSEGELVIQEYEPLDAFENPMAVGRELRLVVRNVSFVLAASLPCELSDTGRQEVANIVKRAAYGFHEVVLNDLDVLRKKMGGPR